MVVALESEDENHVKSEENNSGMRGVEREIKKPATLWNEALAYIYCNVTMQTDGWLRCRRGRE